QAGGDERTRTRRRLDHYGAQADASDNPVAPWKILGPRFEAGRPFAHHQANLPHPALPRFILGRVEDVDAASRTADRAAVHRSVMRGSVDSAGETGNDHRAL